ncbi:hypothetical protein D3C80_1249990 [compost metagenome]
MVGNHVGTFIRVHAQVEELGYSQARERFAPYLQATGCTLFAIDNLPIVIAHAYKVAIIAEVEELVTSTFISLTRQVVQLVEAVQVYLEVTPSDVGSL